MSLHRTDDADLSAGVASFVFDVTADEIRRRSLAAASLGPNRDIAEEERRETSDPGRLIVAMGVEVHGRVPPSR